MYNSVHQTQDTKKVVLVTGASTGLGLALAKQLIKDDKYFLVFTSRHSSAFKFDDASIFNTEDIWIRDLDVIDHQQISNLIQELIVKKGGVDILINNAGISENSTVEDSSDNCRQRQLDVNYLAPFELIAQILPLMRKKKWGKIINVSSSGGFMAMPTMSAYSASKFALEAASESLWYEMKPWGISVTLIVPGFINSLGYLNTKTTIESELSSADMASAYYEHYRGMRALIAKWMLRSHATNEKIAKKISVVLQQKHPPLRIHVTLESLVFYWIRKMCPPTFYHYILFKLLPNIANWGRNKYVKKFSVREGWSA